MFSEIFVVLLIYGALSLTGISVLALGVIFVALSMRFSHWLTIGNAKALFFWSIIYLPLLLGLMVLDKLN